jgi:hypothetical protein
MPLDPLNPANADPAAPPAPATAASAPPGEQADTQPAVRRLDWLFRNAPPTPAMLQLRDIVQRFRLEGRP